MKYYCPCCGYSGLSQPAYAQLGSPPFGDFGVPPYSTNFGKPSYEVCACCGFEFGNDDEPGTGASSTFNGYLSQWISDGCIWFNPSACPILWNLQLQLNEANIAMAGGHDTDQNLVTGGYNV